MSVRSTLCIGVGLHANQVMHALQDVINHNYHVDVPHPKRVGILSVGLPDETFVPHDNKERQIAHFHHVLIDEKPETWFRNQSKANNEEAIDTWFIHNRRTRFNLRERELRLADKRQYLRMVLLHQLLYRAETITHALTDTLRILGTYNRLSVYIVVNALDAEARAWLFDIAYWVRSKLRERGITNPHIYLIVGLPSPVLLESQEERHTGAYIHGFLQEIKRFLRADARQYAPLYPYQLFDDNRPQDALFDNLFLMRVDDLQAWVDTATMTLAPMLDEQWASRLEDDRANWHTTQRVGEIGMASLYASASASLPLGQLRQQWQKQISLEAFVDNHPSQPFNLDHVLRSIVTERNTYPDAFARVDDGLIHTTPLLLTSLMSQRVSLAFEHDFERWLSQQGSNILAQWFLEDAPLEPSASWSLTTQYALSIDDTSTLIHTTIQRLSDLLGDLEDTEATSAYYQQLLRRLTERKPKLTAWICAMTHEMLKRLLPEQVHELLRTLQGQLKQLQNNIAKAQVEVNYPLHLPSLLQQARHHSDSHKKRKMFAGDVLTDYFQRFVENTNHFADARRKLQLLRIYGIFIGHLLEGVEATSRSLSTHHFLWRGQASLSHQLRQSYTTLANRTSLMPYNFDVWQQNYFNREIRPQVSQLKQAIQWRWQSDLNDPKSIHLECIVDGHVAHTAEAAYKHITTYTQNLILEKTRRLQIWSLLPSKFSIDDFLSQQLRVSDQQHLPFLRALDSSQNIDDESYVLLYPLHQSPDDTFEREVDQLVRKLSDYHKAKVTAVATNANSYITLHHKIEPISIAQLDWLTVYREAYRRLPADRRASLHTLAGEVQMANLLASLDPQALFDEWHPAIIDLMSRPDRMKLFMRCIIMGVIRDDPDSRSIILIDDNNMPFKLGDSYLKSAYVFCGFHMAMRPKMLAITPYQVAEWQKDFLDFINFPEEDRTYQILWQLVADLKTTRYAQIAEDEATFAQSAYTYAQDYQAKLDEMPYTTERDFYRLLILLIHQYIHETLEQLREWTRVI